MAGGDEERCVDPTLDPRHCGGCNTKCAVGKVCQQGKCVTDCVGGTSKCQDAALKDQCVDVNVGPVNCGSCGKACSAASAKNFCQAGKCDFAC